MINYPKNSAEPGASIENISHLSLQRRKARLKAEPRSVLWQRSASLAHDPSLQGPGFILGYDEFYIQPLRQMLRALGVGPCSACRNVSQLKDIAEISDDYSFLIVNIDAFASIQEGVEALMTFRSKRPGVVVVIVSNRVSADDLDRSRIAICDATLRTPISSERLKKGLIAAVTNNEWQCSAVLQHLF